MTMDEALMVLGLRMERDIMPHLKLISEDQPDCWEQRSKAYHRIVKDARKQQLRVWHPDVCKHPDAKERTQLINNIADELLKITPHPPAPPRQQMMVVVGGMAVQVTVNGVTVEVNTQTHSGTTSTGSGWNGW